MAKSDVFDPSPYARIPKLTVASAVAVSTALLSSVPKSAPAEVKSSARKLRAALVALKGAWKERVPQNKAPQDPRAADLRVDTAWGALHSRVESASWLPADKYPVAKSARRILDIVFADGLTFLTLPYPSEWAESERRLARIDSENLAADIDKVAGKEYLEELRAAHTAYGETVRAMLTKEEEISSNLLEPLRVLGRRLSAYSRKLLALADEDEPATIAMVESALRPLVVYRDMEARRAAGTAVTADPALPPADPAAPTPEVPQ